MANKRILWVDERTSDYVDRSWDFREGIESRDVQLVICGEGTAKGMQERAIACNTEFRDRLQRIKERNEEDDVVGFIVDVNMPIENLAIYSQELESIGTSSGAYTGFKVVQYVLANARRNMSPFGNAFRDKPVLFLSISHYHADSSTSWMNDDYSDYQKTGKFTKYSHLQKSVNRKSIRDTVKSWVDYAKSVCPEPEVGE